MEKISAKKSLGQNFLKSKKALVDIIKAGGITQKDNILEVGPGKGVLTEAILETGAKVFAIEKDRELIPFLEEKFKNEIEKNQLTLTEGDILDYETDDIYKKQGLSYKVIANIPYYITGALFRKFLEAKKQPEKIVFLVQKEVADRITTKDDKESILSISIKAYGEPKKISIVKKEYFSPKPKVDSAIILIDNISKKYFQDIKESDFFDIIHAGFAHKRKKLISNLEKGLSYKKEDIEKACSESKIKNNARAEEIKIQDWINLTKILNNK